MALKLEYSYKGISANYWKIISIHTDYIMNKTNVILALYADKEARTVSVNNMLFRETLGIDGVDVDRSAAYIAIKDGRAQMRLVKEQLDWSKALDS